MRLHKAHFALAVAFLAVAVSCPVVAAWPPSKCTHVDVLDASDTDQVSWRFDGSATAIDGRLDDAGPKQLETLGLALDLLPDLLCQAVQKVAFVHRPPDVDLLDSLFGDDDAQSVIEGWTTRNDRQHTIYLNTHSLSSWNESNLGFSEEARHQAIHRAVHESAHAAVRLLQSQQKAEPFRAMQDRADADLWPASAQQMARDIIESNRLDTGVMREWQRMHDAFAAAGMAKAYYGGDWTARDGFSPEALAGDGFMSAYGGEEAIEDVAEMTSWAIVRLTLPAPKDAACQVMNGRAGTGVQSADAAVYTKLGFVRTLEFISERQYKSCIGDLKFNAPGEGFYSYRVDDLSSKYTGNVQAGLGRPGAVDHIVFQMSAEGQVSTSNAATGNSANVPAAVELLLNVSTPPSLHDPMLGVPAGDPTRLEDASLPRGVYFIGDRHKSKSRLRIRRIDNGNIIMDVSQGVALVGRSSTKLVEGSVFLQRIFNFSGGLLSAVAGDEPLGEPFSMAFKFERSGGGECQPWMECEIP